MPAIADTSGADKASSGKSKTSFLAGLTLKHRRALIICAHVFVFAVSLFMAFIFISSMKFPRRWGFLLYLCMLLTAIPVKLIVFGLSRQFRGWWRYVGISDLIGIAKASFFSTAILIILWYGYGALGDVFIPQALPGKLDMQIEHLRAETAISSQQDRQLDEQITNLRGLRNLLEIPAIGRLKKQMEQLPQESEERRRMQSYLFELKYLQGLGEGVIMLDWFTTILLLGGLRMFVRLYHEEYFTEGGGSAKRFLIVGAGDAGEALLRELVRRRDIQYHVVGFVDDDPAKQNMIIHGITVLGNVDHLPEICKKHNVDEIAVAIPSASHKQLRRVVQICQGTKLRFRTVPSITDIASGRFKVSPIRDVDINDLLGREVVELDNEQIHSFIRGKVVLVTGAGGSIGSEMCRQICTFAPGRLLLVEQAENPLFFIEGELLLRFPDMAIESIICDITDKQRVDQLFRKYRPDVVFHAAAHKHVPLMETNPGEAIKNNVAGTMCIADAADRYSIGHFVMISTDKAVNPTSVMGSSKRIAEMYIQDLNRTSKTHFITVRFGNVLGSNGSVVPIFKKQIEQGGPVTVTHPQMRRYFMTIPEASQLVLQAAAMGSGGEIFVLDMGEPVRILDLATELITLSGFRPGDDIEIVFTGPRPGEKLFEELSIEGENMIPTRHPKISVWKNIIKDRNILRSQIKKLIDIAPGQDHDRIVDVIKELIPEYIGPNGLNNLTAAESSGTDKKNRI